MTILHYARASGAYGTAQPDVSYPQLFELLSETDRGPRLQNALQVLSILCSKCSKCTLPRTPHRDVSAEGMHVSYERNFESTPPCVSVGRLSEVPNAGGGHHFLGQKREMLGGHHFRWKCDAHPSVSHGGTAPTTRARPILRNSPRSGRRSDPNGGVCRRYIAHRAVAEVMVPASAARREPRKMLQSEPPSMRYLP